MTPSSRALLAGAPAVAAAALAGGTVTNTFAIAEAKAAETDPIFAANALESGLGRQHRRADRGRSDNAMAKVPAAKTIEQMLDTVSDRTGSRAPAHRLPACRS
jgi:hypothetical protein